MGYDDSDGKIMLDKDMNRICFSPPHDPLLPKKIKTFQKLAKKLGGILYLSRYRSTSVHLLGGCNASSNPSYGVCNPNGQVFDPESSVMVHPGLYICDASLIPCSVGINPSLTISTAAEYVSRHLVQDVLKYKSVKTASKSPHSISNMNIKSGLRSMVMFEETMRGYVGGMPCTAFLKMKMNSQEQKGFSEWKSCISSCNPLLIGKVGGYVEFSAIEKDKLHVIDGKVSLCEVDYRTPYTQYMHYHLLLAASSGSRYILDGKKIINPYLFASYAWRETTTLHVKFKKVAVNNSREDKIPKGSHKDFTPSDLYLKFYPSSTLHEIKTEDGFIISCRQWKCTHDSSKLDGPKQQYPVLLLNGYFTESYWLPTEPNDLVRTLLEEGREVWLLQPRLHPLNPSNNFTIEDIGRFDVPAAINRILELHGQNIKIHVVAHCAGGLAIHVALMGGHVSATHIASLSCTNSSMFFKLNPLSLFKMWLPLIPLSMVILGKNTILSSSETKTSLRHQLLKSIARLIPRYERCTYNECEVFSGIFGNAFWHENLSPGMHYWLNKESATMLPMAGFPHLRKICNAGYIVDSKGNNSYLSHPERMRIPTLYISGGRSLLVTPKTSFLANKYMKLHQPGFRHERVVVDGFGHSDLLIGEESYKKVFPHILSHIRSAEGENGVISGGGKKYSKEALDWEDDPNEESGGFGIWFSPFIVILLFVLFIMLLVALC
ncbi:Long-chain-alcohol oxidase FAO4B [Fagus crenata]